MHFPLHIIFSEISKQNKVMVMRMSKNKKVSLVSVPHSAEMAAVHRKASIQVKELIKMYPQYSRASIYRHAKKNCLLNRHKIASTLTRKDLSRFL